MIWVVTFQEKLPPWHKRLDCSECERAHAYKGRELKCTTDCCGTGHPRPIPIPSNEEIIHIYNLVRGQVRTSFGGVADLDYNAVLSVIDLYNIEDKRTCFERVVYAYRYFLREYEHNKEE